MNQSDVALITFALSQTSRAALKLVERCNPLLRENDLHVLDDQITRICRLLERSKNFQTASIPQPRVLGLDVASSKSLDIPFQQAELVFESTECEFHPFVHFEFVASSGSCELLAGAPLPRSSTVLLDPNATTPSSYLRENNLSLADRVDGPSPENLRSNVFALRQMSDELRNTGDDVASIKIVALVQHAFTCALPIPKARNDSTCPWSFKHLSSQDQLELLQNLFVISKTYLDACLRLLPSHFCSSQDPVSDETIDYNQSRDDLDGARTITFACIFAVVDAIISSGTTNTKCNLKMTELFQKFIIFPAMDDFAGKPFETFTAYYTMTRPELVTARELVSSYFISLRLKPESKSFGNWALNQYGGFVIEAHEGDMFMFECLSAHTKLQANRHSGNKKFAEWFCGLGSQGWDKSELNEQIPEVHIYLMLMVYCKVAFCPWKLIRTFIFPEDSSSHNSHYMSIDQLEFRFQKSQYVEPTGLLFISFKDSTNGADLIKLIHDKKNGLIALHEFHEQEATAQFQPNDEHVKCTEMFMFVKPLVYPEADAVYLASLLLVPAMAVPYCLQFFSDNRIEMLESNVLQKKLWNTLFCPHAFQSEYKPIDKVPISGHDRPHYLGTPRGLLMHELEHSPEVIMRPMALLLQQICELAEDATAGLSRRRLLLFLLRCSCIIEHFAASAQIRAPLDPDIQHLILKNRVNLQSCQRRCIPILNGWIHTNDASMSTSQRRQYEIEIHSSLAILHSIPLFDKMDPRVDFGAFFFSACSVMTMLQAHYSVVCPIFEVLHAIHRLRLDATKLTEKNADERDRILRRMWLAQKSGPLPAPQDLSSPWRDVQFDLGVNVEQTLTLTFGKDTCLKKICISFPGVNRVTIHADAIDEQRGPDSDSFFSVFRKNSDKLFEGSKERWYQSDFKLGILVADIVSDSFDVFRYSRESSEKPWSIQLHARAPVNFLTALEVAKIGNFPKFVALSVF